MWETMGPIADRTRERLGASDLAIVQFRRLMVAAARSHAEGGAPIGLDRAARAAGKAALVPGDRAEERQLAHLRRLPEELALRGGIEEDDTERDMAGAAA